DRLPAHRSGLDSPVGGVASLRVVSPSLPSYAPRLSRRFGLGPSRGGWRVQSAVFVNYFGWGGVMPFEILYLHEGRGFSLGIAGLVVGVVTGFAAVGAPVPGPLIDPIGS